MLPKIQTLVGTLRARDTGGSDENARARERNRRALLAGIASAGARAVSIAAVLVSIPVTLDYLGVQRFSVWATITSLAALLSFADFGLGNGLMNSVARCAAKNDHAGLRAYISTALVVLGGVALLGVVLALLFAPSAPWDRILAVDPREVPPEELSAVMTAFIACLAVGIVAAVVQKVQLGLQLGYMASLWQLAASLAALLALVAAVWLHMSLLWLVIAWLATPSVVLLLSGVIFWGYQLPASRPALALWNPSLARELAHSGFLFFVIQAAGAVAFASDTLIVAHVLNPKAVAQYSVVSRLMEGVVMISALFLTPLWPAYAEAYARGDLLWVRRTLVGSLLVTTTATAVLSLILVAASRPITLAWVGPEVAYSLGLFAAFAAWAVIKATGNALSMFLNGIGWIGFQALVAVIFAVSAVIAKIVLTQKIGIIGIPLALAAAYILTVGIPYAWRMPQILMKVRA